MKPKWKLTYEPHVSKQISKLPDDQLRQAVFDSIERLTLADNPTAVSGVAKFQSGNNQWRIHVDYKDWSYRIIFSVRSGQVIVGQFERRGILIVHDVKPKNNQTYR